MWPPSHIENVAHTLSTVISNKDWLQNFKPYALYYYPLFLWPKSWGIFLLCLGHLDIKLLNGQNIEFCIPYQIDL